MKRDTKKLIIQTAIQLFNERSYGDVSMFEISKQLTLSQGNLAYHFKNKERLLASIANQMWEELDARKEKTLVYPSFKNLTEQSRHLFSIQQKYSFIFLDNHLLKHPLLQTKFKGFTEEFLKNAQTVIAFGIQMGNVKPEAIPGTYNQLAFTVWMVCFYWLPQQVTLAKKNQGFADNTLWSLILPYLTEKGILALTQYLGPEKMQSIGQPFALTMTHLLPI